MKVKLFRIVFENAFASRYNKNKSESANPFEKLLRIEIEEYFQINVENKRYPFVKKKKKKVSKTIIESLKINLQFCCC